MTFAKLLQSWWARLPQGKSGKLVVWSDCEELLQAKQLQIPADDIIDMYVPGRLRCPSCKFELSKATIFAQSGEIGASKAEVYQESEPCPNDGERMVRVTWREEADANREYAERLIEELLQATGMNSLPAAMEWVKDLREAKDVEPGDTIERSWERFCEEFSGVRASEPLRFGRMAFYAGAQTFCSIMGAALDNEVGEEESYRQLNAAHNELSQACEEMKI